MSSKRLPLASYLGTILPTMIFQLTLLFLQTRLQKLIPIFLLFPFPFILCAFSFFFFFLSFFFPTFKKERELLYPFHANLKRCFRISIPLSLLAFHPSSKFYLSFFRETKYAKLITPVSLCKLSRTVKFNARGREKMRLLLIQRSDKEIV